MSYWSVVQTETQREHVARLLLMRGRLGEGGDEMPPYETYMPRLLLKAGKVVLLFPRYLFVRIVDRWYPIESTPGVIEILKTGDEPHRLPDAIIASWRKREVGGFVRLPTKRGLRKGDKVQITRGSFQGQIGLYDGMTSQQRVVALLELLGRAVRVELASADVAPLSAPVVPLDVAS